jgi:FKBP-type peptidyl-prolyl cis-trans isomerase SlyD
VEITAGRGSPFITPSKTIRHRARQFGRGEPLAYIQGHGNLVSTEKALEGKQDGNSPVVVAPPAEGYGGRGLTQRVPARPAGSGQAQKGMQFPARTEDGMRLHRDRRIGDMVVSDGNHPLADQTLHFDVEVVGVREATTEELEHGHVHGAGGHHH